MKPYEQIWPDAYVTGQPVRLCGKTSERGHFLTAWLQCRDGRVYNLTKQELLELDPAIKIHSRYRKRKNGR